MRIWGSDPPDRVGLLVPHTNTVMEPDLTRALDSRASLHVARMLLADIERLSHLQVKRLAWLLECAVRGRASQRTLVGAVTRLSKRDERDQAAEQLERWLVQKADEVGLLGRREAA